jgi:methylated-DNA-[protein]-cysteine S-methyltransferase
VIQTSSSLSYGSLLCYEDSGCSTDSIQIHSTVNHFYATAHFTKYIETPLWTMKIETSSTHVIGVSFVDHSNTPVNTDQAPRYMHETQTQLQEYFEWSRRVFDLEIWFSWTAFQQSVWSSLFEIPYGTTMSYYEQASTLLWNPKAVRASARCNWQNDFAVIVPCHRVIAQNGNLTGYKRWLEKKKRLLDHEQKHSFFGR